MDDVTIRELRNRGGEVLRRVEHGMRIRVTRDGDPVATLAPLPRRPLQVEELIDRRRSLPAVDSDALRSDIDDLIDPTL